MRRGSHARTTFYEKNSSFDLKTEILKLDKVNKIIH